MAEKRCISREILDSDAFMDLELSTVALYVYLNLNADDDGFVNNSKKIMKMIGATEKDFKALIEKRFVIYFEDEGVSVIKHWWVHNTKRKDRFKPTKYTELLEQLAIKENGVYTLAKNYKPKPRYSTDNNKEVSEEEEKELMKLMKGKK